MKVLIACEQSQRVCTEFRKRGHEAYSCDLLPCSGNHPEWHLQADALEVCKLSWDLVIAHPPCTHLSVSGARWFPEKQRDGRQQMGIGFFLAFTAMDHIPRMAIENPVGIMSGLYRKPDQIVEPWWFGDPAHKKTCLWLKGLPPLVADNPVDPPERKRLSSGRADPDQYSGTGSMHGFERSTVRSVTWPGMARAMAEQWG